MKVLLLVVIVAVFAVVDGFNLGEFLKIKGENEITLPSEDDVPRYRCGQNLGKAMREACNSCSKAPQIEKRSISEGKKSESGE